MKSHVASDGGCLDDKGPKGTVGLVGHQGAPRGEKEGHKETNENPQKAKRLRKPRGNMKGLMNPDRDQGVPRDQGKRLKITGTCWCSKLMKL